MPEKWKLDLPNLVRRAVGKLTAGASAVKEHGQGAFNPGRGHPLLSAGGCRWNDPGFLAAKERALLAGGKSGAPSFPRRVFERWGGALPKRGVRILVVGGGDDAEALAWADEVPGVETVVYARDDDREFSGEEAARARHGRGWESVVRMAPFHLAISDNALGRLPNIEERLAGLRHILVPGGILAVREYVGPNRYQFTADQLDLANALLRLLPESLRRDVAGAIKDSQAPPELGWLLANDPRAALRSDAVRGEVAAAFFVLEEIELGGAALMPLLAGISHNFLDDSRRCRGILESLWRTERSLMSIGLLRSDNWAAAAANSLRRDGDRGERISHKGGSAF